MGNLEPLFVGWAIRNGKSSDSRVGVKKLEYSKANYYNKGWGSGNRDDAESRIGIIGVNN